MREIEARVAGAFRAHFNSEPSIVASAPGRVNLIGEHTDYNGGFVLPCAIDLRVAVAMAEGPGELFSADYEEALPADGCKRDGWAAYPRGVAWAMAEEGISVPHFHAAFAGDVPQGSGLSSSAAIESATAIAFDALFDLGLPRKNLAVLCQRAENGFVGVNSGIMDQYASLLCRSGEALFIDCRSLEAESVPLDLGAAGLALVVCDTRVERTLAATGYNQRRAACERAAQVLKVKELRDATTSDLERLSGEELRRARHVVTENDRVLRAVDAMRNQDFAEFGRIMFASHASLRDDYEVSVPELDLFVECARGAGALGARLTGAGFGGCAIALVDERRVNQMTEATRSQFAEQGSQEPCFYSFQPSQGAEIAP